jgi:hypothetical protein
MKKIVLAVFLFSVTFYVFPQNSIYDLLNKEIVIHDNWSGQSFTLIYENGSHYIHRKIFGSEVSVAMTMVYNDHFDSFNQISFWEIISISENTNAGFRTDDVFQLSIRNDIELYLNGLRISINNIN